MSPDELRRRRAEERGARMVLRRARVERDEVDLDPLSGEAALSLVERLTLESWSLAGLPLPEYTRAEIPVRFVPRDRAW